MAFDPRKTEITETDVSLPKDSPFGGFGVALSGLAEDLDILTNKMKDQLRQRHRRLLSREKVVLDEVETVAPLLLAGVADENDEIRYHLASVELAFLRRDLLDTRDAMALTEIDDAVTPVEESWSNDETVLVV